jgi:hypothetical protein
MYVDQLRDLFQDPERFLGALRVCPEDVVDVPSLFLFRAA